MPRSAILEEAAESFAVCAELMTTAPRLGQRLEAGGKVGVSPTTACSWAAPVPMRSPTTTSPVAMPTRTCKGPPAAVVELLHRLDKGEPGANRPLRIMLVSLGIAEIGQHAVAHIFGDEPAIALDSSAQQW